MKKLVILGAGGLAREIYDLARICYEYDPGFQVKGFLSDNPSNISDMGYAKVIGTIKDYEPEKYDVFFCAIGNVHDKKKTVKIIQDKGGRFINMVHPTAQISPSAKLGNGVAIKAFCVLSNEVEVGDFTYLQSSVIMGHDVKIGSYCQINSFSFFAGNSKAQDLVTVNAGARIIQNVLLEEQSTVGMGSVVIRNVKKGTTVFGAPAKRIEK